MTDSYLESSAFIKRYKQEEGTDFVNGLFDGSYELFYVNFAILEVRKVFYRLWKYPLQQDQEISEADFQALESSFAQDVQGMHRIEFTEEMIAKANDILASAWVPNIFDLAQLSSYLIAREEYPDLFFVCSDQRSKLVEATKEFVGDDAIVVPEEAVCF